MEFTITEQEELAEEIGGALESVAGICDTSWEEDMAIAAVLLRAGYRKVED